MENEMNRLYREMAETVNEMIPEDWSKFYFYAQQSESGGGTYFFYNTPENKQFTYSVEIPFKFKVDEDEFEKNENFLYHLSRKLRQVFKDHGQELWYSFTISMEKSGTFNLHYDYTNWFETDYGFSDQMMIWKNKYLDEAPNDKNSKAILDQYFREFPADPV